MNVYGVAREVAALYGLPLRPLDTTVAEAGPPAAEALDVAIEAPDLCGRFCARLLDVKVGPSPAWLRDRLELVGIRSISNLVDLTNYVMVEMGQPSHAFDLARVPGGKLVVRWSREGERLVTLDGSERALPPRVGVIAGAGGEPALALAGIMGGASSEIAEATRSWPSRRRGGSRSRCGAGRGRSGCTPRPPTASSGAPTSRPGPPPSPASRTSSAKIGAGTVRPGLVERTGARAPGPDRPAPRRAGERPPRRRGAPAAAGAHAGVARLPRLRLRPRDDRPRPDLAARRLARGGPRGGGGPPLRPRSDRAGAAAFDPARASSGRPSGASAGSGRS